MGWLSDYKHKKLIKKSISNAKKETEKDDLEFKNRIASAKDEVRKKIASLPANKIIDMDEEKFERMVLELLRVKYKISTCQYPKCKNKAMGTSRFRCPYCKKVFCEEHRIPENHKCKNPKLPDSMKRGFGTKMSPINVK